MEGWREGEREGSKAEREECRKEEVMKKKEKER